MIKKNMSNEYMKKNNLKPVFNILIDNAHYNKPQHNKFDEIIPNLWLGGLLTECELIENKFTHVLSIIDNMKPYDESNFIAKLVKLEDKSDADIGKHFEECINFIHEGLNSGGKVYVHCQMGFSRSPSIVIAYIIKYNENMTFKDAFDFVVQKRPCICPNIGFNMALENYANSVRK